MITPTILIIKSTLMLFGYPFYESPIPFKLNIIGIVNDVNPSKESLFNDTLVVIYTDMLGEERVDYFSASLVPNELFGLTSKHKNVVQLLNGHYPDSFERKFEAGGMKLAPTKIIPHFEGSYLPELIISEEEEYKKPNFRIEGKLGRGTPEYLGAWCIGSHYIEQDHEILCYLVEKACQNHGNSFSYTLINQSNLSNEIL